MLLYGYDIGLRWEKFTRHSNQITELSISSMPEIDRNNDDQVNSVNLISPFVESLKSLRLEVIKIGKTFPFTNNSARKILLLHESLALNLQDNMNGFSILRYSECFDYCKFEMISWK